MTKKKNLKFKVGDRVRLVSTATYGPKKYPIPTVPKNDGPTVGELYYVVEDYADGDYDLGLEDTRKYVADTFVGVVHQRHLEPASTLHLPHIHITPSPLGVGDIVVLKDGVTDPYYTGESGIHLKSRNLFADQRYRVERLITGAHSIRVRLGRLSGPAPEGSLGAVDADQLERVQTFTAVAWVKVWRDAQEIFATVADTKVPTVKAETIGQPEPAPKPFTWHDVEVGDKVTARSNIRTIGASMDSEIVHTEIAHRQDHGWNGSDLYWKDLNLTVHRDFDSWTIMNITKAKDLPKPEPKPLDQRRKYQPVQVRRTKSTDGLWLEHEVRTGQKAGVVEQQTAIHTNHGYWVFFADGSKLKLISGRDKVFVAGQQRGYDDAQGKTHTPD